MKGGYIEIDGKQVPRCYCCGSLSIQGPLWRVLVSATGETEFRCEKHLRRLPCAIDGCGRTFAMKAGWHYGDQIVCGHHWRQSPKYMRSALSRVSRIARRTGWSESLYARHHRLFNRIVRAISDGQNLDIAAIEREFGL